MLRDFFLGFVKVHVLHHAAQEPVYGLAMIEELRRHGYEVGPGTIWKPMGISRGRSGSSAARSASTTRSPTKDGPRWRRHEPRSPN
jgi:hypothetical protein